ncbi:MAG: response regulator [Deltaproteobacteria bacterium]|nr:response regulator [Deltaproteobacteria bacterium]
MSNESTNIVVVDDEEMVVKSLGFFFELETSYRPVTFTSPKAALEWLAHNDAGIVISDYLMPEMDGISFLMKVRDLRPSIPRVLLTGYADKQNCIKAINELGLYQYIEKPWNNDDLKIIVRNGLEKKQLMQRLQTKIDEINKAYAELQGIQQAILKTFV